MLRTALRIALAIGLCIDLYVGALALFAPQLIEPLLDIPVRDPSLASIAGGEFVVVALVYAFALRDPLRSRALLTICAVDQFFAVVLPALAVMHGAIPASPKVIAPIPFQALLCAFFAVGASRAGSKRSATPFMQ
ncbi:MAG TPA: hypothetical protein VE591_03940 [Candidatus Acidoferrum sp.]|nr:hypothetical protein [Candidatus Acidoferrum sp.]